MNEVFLSNFQIRDKKLGADCPPYLIAEMACAHDGDMDKARALIDSAVGAGADAVQLQVFSVEDQVVPQHSLRSLLEKLAFSASEWQEIFAYARKYEIAVFAFTYDIPSLQLALRLGIDGIKLSSADLSNPEMLEAAAGSALPITLGTGASTLDEISDALDTIQSAGGHELVLMHGVQNFPTAIEDANIQHIKLLQRVFNLPIGYQDHTDASLPISNVMDLVALGMGISILEKHITLDRTQKGTDYQAALEPLEFKDWVQRMRSASIALGTDQIRPLNESDEKYRKFQKKSVVASTFISAGDVITREKVAFLRTGTPGLAPNQFPSLAGKKAQRDIAPFEPIVPGDAG